MLISNHQHFFHQFLQTARLFTKQLNEKLAEHNLFHSQWAIIYYLKNHNSSTLVEISSYLNVEKPTITRTITRLEERGLIEQVPSENKREKRIQLSVDGEEIYSSCIHTVNKYERSLLAGISEEEMLAITKILNQMQNQLQHE